MHTHYLLNIKYNSLELIEVIFLIKKINIQQSLIKKRSTSCQLFFILYNYKLTQSKKPNYDYLYYNFKLN